MDLHGLVFCVAANLSALVWDPSPGRLFSLDVGSHLLKAGC